jgi:membrane protein
MKLKADAGALLAIGIILAILGASRFYAALDDCFTIIYRLPQRSSLRQNLVAIGMVFMFILLFVLIIVANIVPLFLVIGIENYGARSGIYLLGFLCSLLATFIEFEIIYWVIPNKKMSFKVTWCGALVGAFLLEIVLMWFPLYVRDNTNSYTGK